MGFRIGVPVLLATLLTLASSVAVNRRADSGLYYLVDCVAHPDFIVPGQPMAPDYHYAVVAYYPTKPPAGGALTNPTDSCSWFVDRGTLSEWGSGRQQCNSTSKNEIITVELEPHPNNDLPVDGLAGSASKGAENYSCFKDANQTLYRPFNTECRSRFYCSLQVPLTREKGTYN